MKNTKELREEVESLAIEGQAIFEAAQRASRDLTEEEAERFKAITKKEPGGLIFDKNKELKLAEEREQAYREIAVREQQKSALQEITEILSPVSANQAPQHVLPTNGIMPGDRRPAEPPRIYLRTSKLKCFNNEKDAYDSGMWLRAMIARAYNRDDRQAEAHVHRLGWQMTNVQLEGSGPTGGYLVPAPLSQTIIDVREEVGIARRTARIIPMTSMTLDIPRREGGLIVYYPGEGGYKTPSDVAWSQVSLIAKKRAVATQISQELQDDALINVVDNSVSEMAYALAEREDAEYVNGDGTGDYGGVTGLIPAIGAAGVVDAASGHDTWAEIDLADLIAVMGRLPDRYTRDPVWITSHAFYTTVMLRVMASHSGNALAGLESGPASVPRFLGQRVYFTEQMPRTGTAATIAALYGSFDMGVIIGDRAQLEIGRSDDYAFLHDLITLRAVARYDIYVHAPGDATNAGSYVALRTAA